MHIKDSHAKGDDSTCTDFYPNQQARECMNFIVGAETVIPQSCTSIFIYLNQVPQSSFISIMYLNPPIWAILHIYIHLGTSFRKLIRWLQQVRQTSPAYIEDYIPCYRPLTYLLKAGGVPLLKGSALMRPSYFPRRDAEWWPYLCFALHVRGKRFWILSSMHGRP